jgi:DNA polymerase-3 subunit beta
MTPAINTPASAGTSGKTPGSQGAESDRMELTIQQADLAFASAKALASVSAKSPLPLLSCVLIEADTDGLRITGTDLDVTTSVRVPCTVKKPGRLAVSARHFHDVVRKMSKGDVSLAATDGQCEVRYGGGKGWSRFPTQDPADFPRIPELKADAAIQIEGDALSRLIARTAYAASNEETRPQLNGVLLQADAKRLSLVATDGHRLARSVRSGSFSELKSEGVIIPNRALQAISRAAEDATSPVNIEIAGGKNQAGFTTQIGAYRVQVLTRLLEGPYPNYEQVIPKSNPRELRCARTDLMEAVDIVASHADNVTRQVHFTVRNNRLGVSSATELGSGEHSLEAEYAGDDMDIGYNAGYLLEILRSVPTERVVLKLNSPLSAGVLEPVGALPQAEEELLCLIMPLRLPDTAG